MTSWQSGAQHNLGSPSTPASAKQKPKKPTRGNKTPVPSHRTPNMGGDNGTDNNQDRSAEQGDWDAASSKSDSGVPSTSANMNHPSLGNKTLSQSMLGQQQPLQTMSGSNALSMPSSMDDMNTHLDATLSTDLGNPSALGMGAGASGGAGADDFASMFGVSDIFDFDFDGGNDTGNTSGSGLLGSNTAFSSGAGAGADDKSESDKLRLKAEP